jgi:diguanylate cyclase (GGDEF)-like protein
MESVIAWVRLALVPGVMLAFFAWPGRTFDQSVAVIIETALDAPYAIVVFALKPWRLSRPQLWSVVTAVLDFSFLLAFVFITGGAASPFLPLLIPVLAATAMRFGAAGVGLSAVAITVPLLISLALSELSALARFSLFVNIGAIWIVGVGITVLRREEDRLSEANLDMALESARAKGDLELANWRANTDGLTGIANYSRFYSVLNDSLEKRRDVAVVYIDLNDFKWVNDTLGHLAGDDVLRSFAAELCSAVSADTSVTARLGGDEFGVLLFDDEAANIHDLAARVRRISIAAGTVAVVASVGTAEAGSCADGTELMAAADSAMYEEKRRRRQAPAA